MILILTDYGDSGRTAGWGAATLQAANRKLESKLQSFLFMQPSHGLSYRQSLSLSWGYTRPRMIANLCLGISVEVLSLFVPKDSPWTTIVSTTLFVLVLLLICPLLVRSALELRNFSRANIPINSAVRPYVCHLLERRPVCAPQRSPLRRRTRNRLLDACSFY